MHARLLRTITPKARSLPRAERLRDRLDRAWRATEAENTDRATFDWRSTGWPNDHGGPMSDNALNKALRNHGLRSMAM
jgi:hypothetical protein